MVSNNTDPMETAFVSVDLRGGSVTTGISADRAKTILSLAADTKHMDRPGHIFQLPNREVFLEEQVIRSSN
jgi:3,4-dihydroxy-2-butanone 4-phosphate synthase